MSHLTSKKKNPQFEMEDIRKKIFFSMSLDAMTILNIYLFVSIFD